MNKLLHPINFKKTGYAKLGVVASCVLAVFIGAFIFNYIPSKPDTSNIAETNILGESSMSNATTVSYKTPGSYFELPKTTWIPQTFNNCGPAATAMLLGNFGIKVSQEETKAKLRTGDDDKNIFMYQISDYLKNSYNIESKIFINGDRQTLKTLIANGIYVMAEDWMHPNEDIGHVLIIRGYDDNEGVFIGDDSFIGVGVKYPYEQFDQTQWKPFNREFMPVYTRENEALVKSIIGENWNEKTMYANAVGRNLKEISENENDMYAWFDLGMNYFGLQEFQKAKLAFEKSRSLGWPARMLWYQIEPVITYNKLGEYNKAVELANIGLAGNSTFVELVNEKNFALRALASLSD